MANYTIELKDVIKEHNIFAFNYPFYDESKRKEFEEKFIKHFYFREIGVETVDRFIFYLEEKFNTVFPYYNELFKTSKIEYDKLNNYDVTETHTISRESDSKSSGITSSVNQNFDVINSTSNEDRNVNSSLNSNVINENVEIESSKNVTSNQDNEISESESTSTQVQTNNKTSSSELSENSKSDKKFLDTPQGLLNLDGANYLTTLNQDIDNKSSNVNASEESESNSNTSNNVNAINTKNSSSENDLDRSVESESTQTVENESNETQKNSVVNESRQEQKITNDMNNRVYSLGNSKEEFTRTMVGNIGVMTSTDLLSKHIELQKVLTKIELMFFDECEDLFMLIY